jgi:nicotinamide-nucleotide amidase
MNAIILSVGDELALGQTVDTNSAWLSAQLATVGFSVVRHVTVPDDQPFIEEAIRLATGECDVLLVSGGIGPTEDDLTRQALAAVMGVELEMNDAWLAKLHEFFKARGRSMPEGNKIQAMIPKGAKIILNTAGTAAGIDATFQCGDKKSICRVFVMPGVPKEMKTMFTRDVFPVIKSQGSGAVILQRTLHTFGLGESHVAEKLGELMKRGRNPSVGTTVANGIVSLRVNARFASPDEAQREIDATVTACENAMGDLIFGEDLQTLAEVVAGLLTKSGRTVTTAESCTGGLLSKYLTDISGSSGYFKRGWIVYSDEAKREMLDVPAESLAKHGAVSEEVVASLASNARRLARADFGLAISGVAGPTGGTTDKPVGTVCLAVASEAGVKSRRFNFPGDREMIRDRSAKMAMSMLRYALLGRGMPF